MTEEQIKVLNMLASGTISVEQASQLLAVLGGDDEADSRDLEAEVRAKPERSATAKEPRFGEFTFNQVLRMETEGVEPAFFAKVRKAGLTDLSFEQVLHMAHLGVEPEFFLRAREAGLADLSFEQVLQMANLGVEPEFFSRLREESSER